MCETACIKHGWVRQAKINGAEIAPRAIGTAASVKIIELGGQAHLMMEARENLRKECVVV